jgi:hypothetical protein
MLAGLLRFELNGPFNGLFKWNSSVLTIKSVVSKSSSIFDMLRGQIMRGMVSSQLSEQVGDFWRFFSSLCFCIENVAFCSGGSGTKKHLRPGDATQHQIFIRGGFQEIFWFCHRLVKVSFFGWGPHIYLKFCFELGRKYSENLFRVKLPLKVFNKYLSNSL